MTLRVSSLDGKVTLTVPAGMSQRKALAFAREKAGWLRRHVGQTPVETLVAEEAEVPYRGALHVVRRADVAAVRAAAGVIEVPARSRAVGRAVEAFFKASARDALSEASNRHARALGRSYTALALRDTRSRWGSCTEAGRLMYSWRLIMAPPRVLDYVAAHEVAHLAEMNHSPAFWAHVTDLFGPCERERAWLRHEGLALHRVRFAG